MKQGIDQLIYGYFERDALKHDLNGDQFIDDYVREKINSLSNYELLFYISLAMGEE